MTEQPISAPESVVTAPAKKSYVRPAAILGTCLVIALAMLFGFNHSVKNTFLSKVTNTDLSESESWETSLRPVDYKSEYGRVRPIAPEDNDFTIYYKNIPEQTGVEWFLQPVPLGDLELFTSEIEYDGVQPTPNYYQIGTLNNEPIVYVNTDCSIEECIGDRLFFLGTTTDHTFLLTAHSQYTEQSYYHLNEKVTENSEITFPALFYQPISLEKATLTEGSRFYRLMHPELFANSRFNPNAKQTNPYEKIEFIKDTEYGPLFRGYSLSPEGTAIFMYAVRGVGGLLIPYELDIPENMYSEEFYNAPNIIWNDGTRNTKEYSLNGYGESMGTGREIAVKRIPDSDLEVVGKISTGEKIYSLINPEHPLITRVTGNPPTNFIDYNEATGVRRIYTLTPDELIAQHGVLVFIDGLGDQNLFTLQLGLD